MRTTIKPFAVPLAPFIALLVIVFLLLPLVVYAANPNEFSFGVWQHARFGCVVLFFGSALLLLGRQSSFGLKVLYALLPLCLWLLLGSYVQSQLLFWDYGDFDGTPINWATFRSRLWVDIGIWGFFGIVVWIARHRLVIRAELIAAAILTLHFVSAVPMLLKPLKWSATPVTEELEDIFTLSTQKNVIHIVLDALQSPAFERVLAREPALEAQLPGFVYFRNTTASFPSTLPSIPAFLSGKAYDASEPLRSYFESTFTTASLPYKLDQLGFSTRLATIPGFCQFFRPGLCGETRRLPGKGPTFASLSEYLETLDIALFRASPQPVKRMLYRNEKWFFQNMQQLFAPENSNVDHGVNFAREFVKRVQVVSSAPTYRFLHFLFPHAPIRLNAECGSLKSFERVNTENFLRQTRCSIKVVLDIFARLKELGVYDNSLIIVSADHGTRLDFGQNDKDYLKTHKLPPISRALPLLMVKPFGDSRPFRRSEVPAQLLDIPATVATELGQEGLMPGRSVFDLKEGEKRERIFADFSFRWLKWREVKPDDVFGGFPQYSVNGHAWDARSWQRRQK